MAEHRVSYNGIIYIIPNDELYWKYENGEAFIDKYGRLIDSKSKKVIKELEHKGDRRPVVQRNVVVVQPPEEHPIRDAAKQAVADVAYDSIHRGVDWAFDVGIAEEMTQEEADAEKRKVLYHWLGMLSSLKKLYDAGEIDNIDSTLLQLTEPAMLERVNALLSENPNLLETDKYIILHGLLGRDLYKERQLIPIRAAEITTIAESYGYEARNDKTEDNHNG